MPKVNTVECKTCGDETELDAANGKPDTMLCMRCLTFGPVVEMAGTAFEGVYELRALTPEEWLSKYTVEYRSHVVTMIMGSLADRYPMPELAK